VGIGSFDWVGSKELQKRAIRGARTDHESKYQQCYGGIFLSVKTLPQAQGKNGSVEVHRFGAFILLPPWSKHRANPQTPSVRERDKTGRRWE
jgi:hypothetical protein